MSEIVFIDGKFHPKAEAKISVFDHGLLYGDGVFEGIRCYNRCVFRLTEHLKRLRSSAKYIALKIPLSLEDLAWIVTETIRRNNLDDAYIRLLVTRGVGDLGLSPWLCDVPSIIVIASKIQLYAQKCYDEGLSLMTVPTQRASVSALNSRVKSCNYLNNILAKIEGKNAGVIEALMLDSHGYVVECTGDNIFVVKDGVISTPPSYLGALKGITRDCILQIAGELGYEAREEPFTRFEIFDADECFMTGTAAEIVPVISVDGREINDGKPGQITRQLMAAFHGKVTADGVSLDDNLPEPQNMDQIWR